MLGRGSRRSSGRETGPATGRGTRRSAAALLAAAAIVVASVSACADPFFNVVITNPGMQRWLADEGEHAMRLLTRGATGFQPRLIGAIHALLREETDAGRLDLPADLGEVAYVIVRLIESYTYMDLITGETPSAERAEPILRMLLVR